MSIEIILLGAILINISIWGCIIRDNITDINKNLEKILKKMDEK